MKRLVYSPNVKAYIGADTGVVDVSPYITGGSVNRKMNQVSSAQLTLRNPVKAGTDRLIWTEHLKSDGSIGPMFHPMDPIIVILTRFANNPIQVFTGYLDKAPYFALYPGLCTVEASCTLKRLLYTQWDPSLPFTETFLQQFGWILNADNGIVSANAQEQSLKAQAGQIQGKFNDGSIGGLLFAVLNIIGQWDASTIWIEELPPQIKDIVTQLYQQEQGEVQQGDTLFKSLLTQILGTGAQGGGGPSGNAANGTLTAKGVTIKGSAPSATQLTLIKQVMNIAVGLGAPHLAIQALLEACIQENGFTNNPGGDGTSNGLLQVTATTAASTGVDPLNVEQCVTYFLRHGFYGYGGAITQALADPNQMACTIAQHTQGSNFPSAYCQWLGEANAIIHAYSAGSSSTTNNNTPNNGASTAPASSHSVAGHRH